MKIKYTDGSLYTISDPIWGSTINVDTGLKFTKNAAGRVLANKASTWLYVRKYTFSFENICDTLAYKTGGSATYNKSELDIIIETLAECDDDSTTFYVEISDSAYNLWGNISGELITPDYGWKLAARESYSLTFEILEVV